jgi:hypothetical protein
MTEVRTHVSGISGRRFGDFLLFGVTSAELALLFLLTPTFTIYIGSTYYSTSWFSGLPSHAARLR